MRKIIHIDMDAFYASVEQRDFPEFRGKALAVGGSPDGRGVVATASYEARKYGVKSAMSSRMALKLCPQLIFTRPRFEVYKEVSNQIRAIFRRYTDLIEPLSLDEAYLDVTQDKLNIGSALEIAQQIKDAIQFELNLTASAGISVNKFVAKIASDIHKPNGLTFIGPSKIIPFLESLPIERFFGVGRVTAEKMKGMGIFTGSDLKNFSEDLLKQRFGKSGKFFHQMVRGIDDRPVKPNRIRKSIGIEDTFENDLHKEEDLLEELLKLSEKLTERIAKSESWGRTLTLKVKFADFSVSSKSKTYTQKLIGKKALNDCAKELFALYNWESKAVRLLGLTISNFIDPAEDQQVDVQLRLF
ncbi:DNA polymerase IV [Sphingobacterium sp. HJSM2_6]|uniref:DNA polymerase IV n=1 Tax=Sphingobacterium sp. HJSM2_6 TaxID=3366264 RepID=UPI003BED73A1